LSISDEAELAAFLARATDEEVGRLATTIGVDEVLDQVFAGMQSRFRPDTVAGQDAVVRWDLRTPQGDRTFFMIVRDGAFTLTRDSPGQSPRVMLGLDFADFLRLITGQLDGMQAFMSGRLRLSGDMLFAQNVQEWFG
jgi:putative sterol carrier protein